jgi:hypothetical protein
VLVFNVKSGEVDGTDVSGLKVAAVADTPKVMSEGNWRLGVVIDAAASDEQAEKLGGVFHPAGSELTVSRATRSSINAFGIQYEGNSGFSTSEFAWAA